MIRRVLALMATLVAVGAMATGASADGSFSDRLLYDCGPLSTPLCGGDRDMVGFDAGWVTSNQRQNGNLQVNIAVRGGDPNTEYSIVLWCGPTHATAGSLCRRLGRDDRPTGRANVSFIATAAQLLAACGAGSHTSHVDLDSEIPRRLPRPGSRGACRSGARFGDGPRTGSRGPSPLQPTGSHLPPTRGRDVSAHRRQLPARPDGGDRRSHGLDHELRDLRRQEVAASGSADPEPVRGALKDVSLVAVGRGQDDERTIVESKPAQRIAIRACVHLAKEAGPIASEKTSPATSLGLCKVERK